MTAPAPDSKPSVLLIDDEPNILELMRVGLEKDYEIETAASAEEATLLTGTRQYDLIVCDQIMPGQNGLEFLMQSAERHPATRRIMLTGYINPELLSRAVPLAGLSACILKPALPDELKRAIQKALAAK
ncbi:MAG: two-component system [Verrucomicrobia bacterium]|jgi:two-component system, NtrC family, response regulator HupR/HoxA|nr:MAG: two-component system [Verrucomicrobiota bacterium]